MNIKILFVSIIYFIAQNSHFGWHTFAQSDLELICDGINMILIGNGIFKIA